MIISRCLRNADACLCASELLLGVALVLLDDGAAQLVAPVVAVLQTIALVRLGHSKRGWKKIFYKQTLFFLYCCLKT